MQDSLKNENRPTRRDLYVSRTTPALYMYIHIYVYIYIYIYRKREKERERGRVITVKKTTKKMLFTWSIY